MRSFEDINPFVLFIYFVAVSALPMFLSDGILYSISLVCAISLYLVKNRFKGKTMHIGCFILFVVLTLLNGLFSHNGKTVLLVINNSPITLEAFIFGMYSAMLIISVIYWCAVFSNIMTSDKLLYIFGRVSSKFALVISMTLRYIPMFISQSKAIKNSLKLTGEYKDDNVIDKLKSSVKVFSIMVTWTLENGITTAESMESRGYGIGKRSSYSEFKVCLFDVVFLLITIVLFLAGFMLSKKSDFVFYPEHSVHITQTSLLGYLFYGVLSILPLLIELKEMIKWKYLRQKI